MGGFFFTISPAAIAPEWLPVGGHQVRTWVSGKQNSANPLQGRERSVIYFCLCLLPGLISLPQSQFCQKAGWQRWEDAVSGKQRVFPIFHSYMGPCCTNTAPHRLIIQLLLACSWSALTATCPRWVILGLRLPPAHVCFSLALSRGVRSSYHVCNHCFPTLPPLPITSHTLPLFLCAP